MLNEVVKVSLNGKEIYLLGTAHVSEESARIVEKSIEAIKPEVVAVELDRERYQALKDKHKWENLDIYEVIRSGKGYLFLMHLLLANFQRRISESLNTTPGIEMISAIKKAKELNLRVEFVDRDIRITLKRALAEITLLEKLKLLYSLVEDFFSDEGESIEEIMEKLKEKDVLNEMLAELSKEVPSLKRVLVDERDRYIAYKLYSLKAKRVLAVLGAGHISGIKHILENLRLSSEKISFDEELKKLEEINTKKANFSKLLKFGIPAAIIFLFLFGFYLKGFSFLATSLEKWILINGSLAALGAMLALAHPLSVLTAFIAAPITSLNPFLAAGWFSGLVEAKLRKPRVKDFEALLKINSITDLWRNRVTRILLVVLFANLGSSLGTWIAGLSIISDLLK